MFIPISFKNPKKPVQAARSPLGCAVLLLLCLTCLAPHPAKAAGSGNWRTYTTADGLLSNNIQALAYREDPTPWPGCDHATRRDCPIIPGLWVGTDKGLTYLNGREHVNFVDHLPSPDVRDLIFTADGKLWIATAGGLTWLDNKRTPQDLTDDEWGSGYLTGREILTLTSTNEAIWAGTAAGLVKIDLNTDLDYTYLPTTRITALPRCAAAFDGNCDVTLNGYLWFATGGDLSQIDLTSAQSTPTLVNNVPLTATAPFTITDLTRSAEGIWIASSTGVAFWNGATWNPTPLFDGMNHLRLRDIRAIDIDKQNRIWLATNAGATYWHTERRTWRRYFQPRDPIASNDVQTLLIDAHSAAWFGTTAGLSSVDNAHTLLDQNTTYDYSARLPSNLVNAIDFDAQGRTWVSTGNYYDQGGVTVIDSDLSVLRSFTSENGLTGKSVSKLSFDSQGRIWVGTYDGG